ncbi:DUF6412 domain-containing protein [Streptomyces reniochalinae]|uniref:Uncharacterized protein n=1 Tax=Streptomyces reniochalinae TaxID=2250578 RepID=A0A367F585_9ACTN|nr:hypothetical protein DQ392_02020 [Streptomyces reniochalinae]
MHAMVLLLLLVGLFLTHSGPATGLAAVAATAAVTLLCGVLAGVGAAAPPPRGRVRTAIRDRERRTAFLPQRDPDSAGRPRPRAPGRRPATAAHIPGAASPLGELSAPAPG